MKLIIQIPCFNEEKTLSVTLSALPRTVHGFDSVEWLIIDDGSTDKTVEVAKAHGVDHIVRHAGNMGLARAFRTGIDACLHLGADVIVNTDADNQYNADDIPANYTYTLETIIQAGQKNMAIVSVPIRVNKQLRPSHLVKSVPDYIRKSILTILRIFIIYRPFVFFGTIGAALFFAGFLIGLRFLWKYLGGEGSGHIQSLILSSILLGMGFQTLLISFIADLLSANRKLLEDIRFRTFQLKKDEHSDGTNPKEDDNHSESFKNGKAL
ncbi:MAG: glycosyl transferase [Deltaproteobacteria bacterium HGW-Deltaproteobacteria-1]|nr:MAG: glycosyl transferase [Deltaproteobacteria bacterium HGW-Deltaproteobacteria-1]